MEMRDTSRRHFLARAALAGAASLIAVPAIAKTPVTAVTAKKKLIKPKRQVVALDPGHGGKDPGAIGARGTHEKEITIAVAHALAARLEATGKYDVVLTRHNDSFIPLPDRVRLARAGNSALFVSLHADSIANHHIRGFSVYTLSDEASDEFAAALAKRENAVDRIGGVDFSRHPKEVRTILMDLMHRETTNNSTIMAETIVSTLNPPFEPLEHTHRQANFAVLRAPDIPSILVEMGFLSNVEDEKLLNQRSYQAKLTDRLKYAIDGYFQTA
jgi:N-acetylmuramoyl-L-alanine amidase